MVRKEIISSVGIAIIVIGVLVGFLRGWLSLSDITSLVTGLAGAGIAGLFVWGFKPRFEKEEFADLEIIHDPNDIDQYCFFSKDNDKKYLTICVKNNGNGIARKCKARLKITRKHGTRYPSTEWKFLRWAYKNTEKMTINSMDQEFLNVVFSVEKSVHNMSAFIANTNSINFPEKPREKDGSPEGEFEFTIYVNAKNGESVESKFRMNVTNNWKELAIKQFD